MRVVLRAVARASTLAAVGSPSGTIIPENIRKAQGWFGDRHYPSDNSDSQFVEILRFPMKITQFQ